tara:strand:- start:1046 stop:1312 length:267 start_codon:yes stop_codon:yes gene_type:complete
MSNQLIDLGIEKYLKRQRLNDFKGWVIVIVLLIFTSAYIHNKEIEINNKNLIKFKEDFTIKLLNRNKMFMDSLIRFAEDNKIENNIIK